MTSKFNKKLIIIIGLLTSINTFAYDFEVDGLYYNVISIPELICEVTYKDTNYNSYKGEISIPEIVTFQNREIKVVSIGNSAFRNCNEVTSISIPNSVPSIGDDAFYGCIGLTSITIPNSVTSIGDDAFYGCTGLTSITIPNSVTEIGGSMFRGCSGLTSVTIPNSVTSITGGAFEYCTGLTEVTIPNSVTSIGDDAFRGCSSLTSVTIPNSITSIGNKAFDDCARLTELIIDDGPEMLSLGYDIHDSYNVGEAQFYDCPLEKLYLGRNLSYNAYHYGYSPFYNKLTLKTITISGSVTDINSYAFSGCTGLTSITIPNSVTSIDNYAFDNCTNLAEVIIEDGEKTLSLGYCYRNPSGNLGAGLFYDCPLKKLYIGRNLDYNTNLSAGNSPFYKNNRTIESMVISNSVTELHDKILYVNIKHLTFLDGKTEISLGSQGLSNSWSLDSLYLGRNLSAECDYSPSNLSHLTIGENANNITPLNLKNCTQLYAIESKNLTPPTIGEFSSASYISASVIIPHGSINSYLTADVWKNFWNISEAGIESTICDDDISLTIKNGNIIINNIDSPQVEVYNINGQIVYKGNSTIIPVSTNGLYFVKINNKSYKVIL